VWIDEILESTTEFESPERYFYWSALSAISAICRKNVYLNKFGYNLYPNLYVLLIGASGLRKGLPISIARQLVEKVHCTRVLSGRGSIQGIIKELSKAYTLPDGTILKDAFGFIVSSEFDAMLVQDDAAFTLLTDLYDTHDKKGWDNIIKTAGTEHLKHVYLGLLGASNETNLAHALPHNAVGGGFIARTIIVLEDRLKCLNPLTRRPKKIPDIEKLSTWLFKIANVKGEFHYSPEGMEYYEHWYANFMTTEGASDTTGTMNRLHDTVIKVAMCISLAKKEDLILEKEDLIEAVERCKECVPGMKRIFLGHGEHALSVPTGKVMTMLLLAPNNQMLRRKMLVALYGVADAIDLDRIIDSLLQQDGIDSFNTPQGVMYRMKANRVAEYMGYKREEK
jgi:hypothetical protein